MDLDSNIKTGFIILLVASILFACTTDQSLMQPDEDSSKDPVVKIIPNGDEKYLNMGSDYIFDQERLKTYELIIPELSKIDNNPAAEEYVEASLIFEGDTISPVGVRYKGSIGAFVNCLTGQDFLNPSGVKKCSKLSMKVKVNWDGSKYEFFNLKKLQFHSMNLDKSQMRERLAYHFFNEMGIPSPRCVHARLIINGNFAGLFALVEQIDGSFADDHFQDGSGNVYKEIWPLSFSGQVYAEQNYKAALKTNEEDNPSVQRMMDFATEIHNAASGDLKTVIRKWMDVDKIIKLAAIDRTIKVDDGPFHWYCGGGGCDNHNYYWYEEPDRNKIHLIPWDMDNAFENLLPPLNPVTPIKDEWGEITNDCRTFNFGAFAFLQRSAACDKLTSAWVQFAEEYEQYKNEFKAGPLSKDQTEAILDQWREQIFEATLQAQAVYGDAVQISVWESAIENLKLQLEEARK